MQGIDISHAKFIHGLVASAKPKNILELGYGAGESFDAIVAGVAHNLNHPQYTIVDNWHDWGGRKPDVVADRIAAYSNYFSSVDVKSMNEGDFINWWCGIGLPKFDFIMSDADHQRTHEWADRVFTEMLADGGWLIYHDVDGAYPGLYQMRRNLENLLCKKPRVFVFDQSTRPDEECERGLLVIQK